MRQDVRTVCTYVVPRQNILTHTVRNVFFLILCHHYKSAQKMTCTIKTRHSYEVNKFKKVRKVFYPNFDFDLFLFLGVFSTLHNGVVSKPSN